MFVVNGGKQLEGTMSVSGSKNASIPILVASILTSGVVTLRNLPFVSDIRDILNCLIHLGCRVKISMNETIIEPNLECQDISYLKAISNTRASVLFLGPLLARKNKATIKIPGGCKIGARQIDLHIKFLEEMGAAIEDKDGLIVATTNALKPIDFTFSKISVGATETAIMTAVLVDGLTTLRNVAIEPEVVQLINFLNTLGAKITLDEQNRIIKIQGVDELSAGNFTIEHDRIEAFTFLVLSILFDCKIGLNKVDLSDFGYLSSFLTGMGIDLVVKNSAIYPIFTKATLDPFYISTAPYPGFPTDSQPLAALIACLKCSGESVIEENLFENRFQYLLELIRMGANIKIDGHKAFIRGVPKLKPDYIFASDLRSAASLLIAALYTEGTTTLSNSSYIDRGYENIEKKLLACGADIKRKDTFFKILS